MAKQTDVKETTTYENCMELLTDEYQPPTLSRFLGESEDDNEGVDVDNKEWKKHWVGMPSFEQDKNEPYKKILLSFRNKEDYEEFAKLVDQNLSEKTKSIWYPKLNRDENSLKRWIEE
jgi:hypothetical protein